MTKDEIIEMAEQAGMTQDGNMWFSNGKEDMDVEHKHLVAFAKLVAAKEKEALANVATEDTSKERVDETVIQRHEQEPTNIERHEANVQKFLGAPQPEQEPMAWADLRKEAQQIVESKFLWKKFIDGTPLSNDIACWMAEFAQQYAPPPQRTWVGLTAGEILDALISVDEKTVRIPSMLGQFACAIEAKLKEKNSA